MLLLLLFCFMSHSAAASADGPKVIITCRLHLLALSLTYNDSDEFRENPLTRLTPPPPQSDKLCDCPPNSHNQTTKTRDQSQILLVAYNFALLTGCPRNARRFLAIKLINSEFSLRKIRCQDRDGEGEGRSE